MNEISDRQAKRQAKKDLLDRVIVWLDENEEQGRAAFQESASAVIADLREIEMQLSQAAVV